MIFNPVRGQEIGFEIVNQLQDLRYEENRPMGNIAMMSLRDVILLWLLGFYAEAKDFLPKFYLWINRAAEEKEIFGENFNFHMMNLHSAAAMCKWMESGVDDTEHWDLARKFNGMITIGENVYTKSDFLGLRINKYLAYSNLSGEHRAGIDEYEKYCKFRSVSSGVLTPRDFAYASCLHYEKSSFDQQDLLKAGRKMLRKYLQERWLGNGQFVEAAIWLKIVYQHANEVEISPLQTILKAYDDMPDVIVPDFVKQ